jgi:UDP-N-acetyl-2-amino-2-deoxyglucuronate dehydrogenase
MVREALALGKKVICEKPLTIFNDFKGLDDANVVLQLRYNPRVNTLWMQIQLSEKPSTVDIIVKTYREPEYWNSWKGQPEKSGGILYNMGIHYLDLLQYLLGKPKKVIREFHDPQMKYYASGTIEFEKGIGNYHIELLLEPQPIIRKIIVNGVEEDLEGATIPLNGDYVNLHTEVYRDVMEGNGIQANEAIKSINLINKIMEGV